MSLKNQEIAAGSVAVQHRSRTKKKPSLQVEKLEAPICVEARGSNSGEASVDVVVGPKESDGLRDVIFRLEKGEEVHRGRIDDQKPNERKGLLAELSSKHSISDDVRKSLDEAIVDQAARADRWVEETAVAGEIRVSSPERQSASALLLQFEPEFELFHTPEDRPYATVKTTKGLRTMAINGDEFKKYLTGLYYDKYDRPPSEQAKTEAIACLEAKAIYRGEEEPVFVRYAKHEGHYYVDLADDKGTCIEIGPEGWKASTEPPVKFIRPPSTLPLPEPKGGGKLELLQKYVNIEKRDWPLLAGFVMAAAMPEGPYPVLVLQGEQGTAKSTTLKFLGKVIDPRIAGQRSEVRKLEDLQIAAANSHLLAFDNLSYLRDEVSDVICRISTGGGFGTRRLYSDCEEVLIEVCRPVALNGICELVSRGDMLDRSLVFQLPSIDSESRRSEVEMNEAFKKDCPLILGALYDAIASSLKRRGQVDLKKEKPRLVDFAVRVTAAEPELGLADGEFMTAYVENRAMAHLLALDAHPVGHSLGAFIFNRKEAKPWTGSATELLDALNTQERYGASKQQHWPSNPKALSDRLRRLKPHFEHVGLDIHFQATSKKRRITITASDQFAGNWRELSADDPVRDDGGSETPKVTN